MNFADLYDYAARFREPIIRVRRDLCPRIIMDHGDVGQVNFWPVEIDEDTILGYMIYDFDRSSPYGDEFRIVDVRYGNALNRCWRRFVCCKELMHVFDSEEERTDTRHKFYTQMAQLESPPLNQDASAMLSAEIKTVWMALAVLCPLPLRNQYRAQWQRKEITDYDVALKFRIPEVVIHNVMSDYFEQAINRLISEARS